jgi:hemerythrin-like domain-containing protein
MMNPGDESVGRLTAGALADFGHPLQVLLACHQRITAHSDMLAWLARHLHLHDCDPEAQQVASFVLRFFDGAARHHHEDEDESLFPAMRNAARGENAERVARLCVQLAAEHREMEQAWGGFRESLELIAHGERVLLRELDVDRFCKLYHAHIALEEANLIPLAGMLLSPEDLSAIGRAMAARRGVKWP